MSKSSCFRGLACVGRGCWEEGGGKMRECPFHACLKVSMHVFSKCVLIIMRTGAHVLFTWLPRDDTCCSHGSKICALFVRQLLDHGTFCSSLDKLPSLSLACPICHRNNELGHSDILPWPILSSAPQFCLVVSSRFLDFQVAGYGGSLLVSGDSRAGRGCRSRWGPTAQ